MRKQNILLWTWGHHILQMHIITQTHTHTHTHTLTLTHSHKTPIFLQMYAELHTDTEMKEHEFRSISAVVTATVRASCQAGEH